MTAPEWLPNNVTVYADFENGNYWNGIDVVASPIDIFLAWSGAGYSFSPELIVANSGYESTESNFQGLKLLPEVQARLNLFDISIIFEVAGRNDGAPNLGVAVACDDSYTDFIGMELDSSGIRLNTQTSASGQASPDDAYGENSYGSRMKSGDVVMAVNGITSGDDFSENYTGVVNPATLGFWLKNTNKTILRKIYFSDPSLSDAQLQALTA